MEVEAERGEKNLALFLNFVAFPKAGRNIA
jgi:hypothetical protein